MAVSARDPYAWQAVEESGELHRIARKVRRNIIRMIVGAQSGHPGGCLSEADILVAMYYSALIHNPDDPFWPKRDRFILSKGHGAAGLYSVLAEIGYFEREELAEYRKLNSQLQGHPALDRHLMGIEASTGSLGQGLSIANGLALAAKLDGTPTHFWALLGDGELDQGNVWEAVMTSAHYRLDNVTAIIDNNNLQIDGPISEVKNLYPLADKFKAFNWRVLETDGHDFGQLVATFHSAKAVRGTPTVILARTVKGKGVDYMENKPEWHAKAPTVDKLEATLNAIDRYYRPIFEQFNIPWPTEEDAWPS